MLGSGIFLTIPHGLKLSGLGLRRQGFLQEHPQAGIVLNYNIHYSECRLRLLEDSLVPPRHRSNGGVSSLSLLMLEASLRSRFRIMFRAMRARRRDCKQGFERQHHCVETQSRSKDSVCACEDVESFS